MSDLEICACDCRMNIDGKCIAQCQQNPCCNCIYKRFASNMRNAEARDNQMREEGIRKSSEELWRFCLENGAEQHGDLLALPNDPFFPLKLIKKIAEMHIEVKK